MFYPLKENWDVYTQFMKLIITVKWSLEGNREWKYFINSIYTKYPYIYVESLDEDISALK